MRFFNFFQKKPIWLRWVGDGFWALMDQALFSAVNFIVNILLARWLKSEEYGAFAIAISIFYLLAGFHTAIVTEPMMVFGAGKYSKSFREYFSTLLYVHIGITFVATVFLALAAYVVESRGSPLVAQALFGLSLSLPLMLLIWLVRRGCYVWINPACAAVTSGLNLTLVLLGLLLLKGLKLVNPFSGLLLLGTAAGFSSLIAIGTSQLRPKRPFKALKMKEVLIEHYKYGRWALGSSLLVWVPWNSAYLLLPWFSKIEDAAKLKAIINLLSPIIQFNMALSLVALQHLARIYNRATDRKLFAKNVLTVLYIFSGAALLYAFLLSAWGRQVLYVLYSNKYIDLAPLIPLASILPILAAVASVLSTSLRSMNKPDQVFLAYVIASLTAVPSVILLSNGVLGAILYMLLFNLVLVLALLHRFVTANRVYRGG